MNTTLGPLRQGVFRRIWVASLFCNCGQQIQAVAAAWAMVKLSGAPDQVALVQTASLLPVMLLAVPGGVFADLYDRRKVAIVALALGFIGALALSILSFSGATTPALVLAGCFVVGMGVGGFTPAWQASATELIGPKDLPAGVALYSLSNNVARGIGPAIGGVVVLAVGAPIAFGLNALFFLPMLLAFVLWKRPPEVRKLPPENLGRAALAGLRYAVLSPPVRRVLLRTWVTALGASVIPALLPLVASTTLGGDAGTFGLLLGAFGVGAIAAALLASVIRGSLTAENIVRVYSCAQGIAALVVAVSPCVSLSAAALFVAGACWVTILGTYNISIQMAAPRWVSGRLLAIFHASVMGGGGLGSWVWGHIATGSSVPGALLLAGGMLLLSPLLGIVKRLPPIAETETLSVPAPNAPEVQMDLTGRCGPILIEMRYCIAQERANEFLALMRQIRRVRERNGAFDVGLSHDIADPKIWTESCRYPTWHDYVRARDRPTKAERELQAQVNGLHEGPEPVNIRRMLKRPFAALPGKHEPSAESVADAGV